MNSPPGPLSLKKRGGEYYSTGPAFPSLREERKLRIIKNRYNIPSLI